MSVRETVEPDYDSYPAEGIHLSGKTAWLHVLNRFTAPKLAIVGIVSILIFGKADWPPSTICLGLVLVAALGLLAFWSTPSHASTPKQFEEEAPQSGSQRRGPAATR